MSTTKNQVDPYRCSICNKHHVVPSLARDCEVKHEKAASKASGNDKMNGQ